MLGSVQDIWAGIVARMQTAANSLESDFDDITLHNEDDVNEKHDILHNLLDMSHIGIKSPTRSSIIGRINDDESQVSHAESGNNFLTSLPDMFDKGQNSEYSDDDHLLEELRAISTKSIAPSHTVFTTVFTNGFQFLSTTITTATTYTTHPTPHNPPLQPPIPCFQRY